MLKIVKNAFWITRFTLAIDPLQRLLYWGKGGRKLEVFDMKNLVGQKISRIFYVTVLMVLFIYLSHLGIITQLCH